ETASLRVGVVGCGAFARHFIPLLQAHPWVAEVVLCDLDADKLTLHVSGGEAMLTSALEARERAGRPEVAIVGVTVLTHLDLEDFRTLFASARSPEETVLELARAARAAGLDGIVASARELPAIRSELGRGLTIVTPGIRPPGAAADDQTRVVTPRRAVDDGADYIVVGRPIIAAPDPQEACRAILDNMIS
ncbi:MAG: orotidine-5'-phosphate decarboxylase, partial [Candidatus Krumholzibacteriia bacterium]